MFFSAITTKSFRNLTDAKINTKGKDIFLIGKNGQGKSNFLEAVYFCSYASSFRNSKDSEMICENKNECFVRADFFDIVDKYLAAGIKNGKKSVIVDGKQLNSRMELLSIVSSVVFCYEDLDFISGASERRRWFFDQNICLYDAFYLDSLQRYKRVLKSRNALLKEIRNGKNSSLLDIIDPQLIGYGIQIIEKRKKETLFFSDVFNYVYENISGISGIKIKYKESWKSNDMNNIMNELKNHRERDIITGTTCTGPHRDNYIFVKSDDIFDNTASTGQKRLLALILRVAQTLRYFEMTKKEPILLFDDVLLELDGEKRKRFLLLLPPYKQAFYTFLPDEHFEDYRKTDTIVYYVQEGNLIHEDNR
jgi:DNA replication and repair protein RecF